MMDNKRLKVCHFSSVHHINDTRVFHRECVWLAKEYDVTLIAIGQFNGIREGVNIISVPKPDSRIRRILRTTLDVYRLAKAQDADVYHFHDPELIPLAWLLKRKGKKVIYDIHENVTESMKDKSWLPLKWLFIWLYLRFDALAASAFSLVLAEQSYINVYQRRYPAQKLTLTRNYAPAKLLEPYIQMNREVNGNEVRIFYMGTVEPLYCCMEMLESVYLLNKQGVNASLTLIGWTHPNVLAQIEALPYINSIRGKVTFAGSKDIRDGYALSRSFHIGYSFVSDNLNVSQSLPRKMYEYMHIGLPVISSGHKLYKDLVETYALGLCVNNNTGVEIAQAVKAMLGNKGYLNQLAKNNIEAAQQHFNWETEYDELVKLYRSL